MTWRTALCGAFNRFNDILQLDIEPGVAVARRRSNVIPAQAGIYAPFVVKRR